MKAVSRLSTKIFQFEQELDNVWKKTALKINYLQSFKPI